MIVGNRLHLILAVVLVAGCATVSPPRLEVPPGPRALDAASSRERADYLRSAQVWRRVPTATLDLLSGPPGDDAFGFEEAVACEYEPAVSRSGHSPKFYCKVPTGETVKVKYGAGNKEVFAEVAGTRLFWALGFGTDRQYPVKVTCRNCAADPWRHPEPEPGALHTFDPAAIERPPEGTAIEVRNAKQGWAWWELQRIDERAGGAPPAHVDALRLLATFVQHSDNKDEQQRLVCLPEGVQRDAEGHETCSRPFLFTVDLGATFARASRFNTRKFSLHDWSSVPVWKDKKRCIARLKRSFTASFSDPAISEAGRAFLADLLLQLSTRQIHDLFVAAGADAAGERFRGADGLERPVTADDWVQTFERKRADIVDHRCPE